VIPIHWGTYFPIHLGLTRKPAFLDLPPVEFVAAMRERAPEIDVQILAVGESVEL
jgi:L-ascorbate metabolism protein UlaG (beta-lactamase superfamily)